MNNHQNENNYDDLTVIKGIRETRQNWLRETLQVRTLSDLAVLSVDDVIAHLPEGQIVSRSQVESWIRQAKNLSAAKQPQQTTPKRENGWHPFASFVIEFQQRDGSPQDKRTTIHYMEADNSNMWTGQVTEALCEWIAGQLGGVQQGGFSTKLRQVITKTQPDYIKTAVPSTIVHKSNEPGFSEKLQTVIAKTRTLTSSSS